MTVGVTNRAIQTLTHHNHFQFLLRALLNFYLPFIHLALSLKVLVERVDQADKS